MESIYYEFKNHSVAWKFMKKLEEDKGIISGYPHRSGTAKGSVYTVAVNTKDKLEADEVARYYI